MRRKPIKYYGGKYWLTPHLLELIPPHRVYVEVFGGSASLLFAKTPSQVEVYNDIDGRLVNFFKVLRDPEKCLELYKRLALTLYSRSEYYDARDSLDEGDEVERAVKLFIAVRQGFSAELGHGWSFSRFRNQPSTYFTAIDFIPVFHTRLKNVYVECDDFRKIIPRYDSEDTFFYLDPPYLNVKNVDPVYHMAESDHEELVDLLLGIKGKALLSGYRNKIYRKLEKAGWKHKNVKVPLFAQKRERGGREYATECLWWNY